MNVQRQDRITATARVYKQRGRLRAAVESGEARGYNVRCPHEWRDDWKAGQTVTLVGVVVDTGPSQNTQAARKPYFKAQRVIA